MASVFNRMSPSAPLNCRTDANWQNLPWPPTSSYSTVDCPSLLNALYRANQKTSVNTLHMVACHIWVLGHECLDAEHMHGGGGGCGQGRWDCLWARTRVQWHTHRLEWGVFAQACCEAARCPDYASCQQRTVHRPYLWHPVRPVFPCQSPTVPCPSQSMLLACPRPC